MATKTEHYVYVLCDPFRPTENVNSLSTNPYLFRYEPFYVGMGTKLRFYEHISSPMRDEETNPQKCKRVRSILRKARAPHVVILRKSLTKEQAFEIERRAIEKLGRKQTKTGPLLNRTSGGPGLQKLVLDSSDRQRLGQQVKNWWASLSKLDREAFIAARKKKQNSPEVKARQSTKTKAHFAAMDELEKEAFRKKCGEVMKARWAAMTPKQRAERSAKVAAGRHYSKSKAERAAINKKATKMRALNRKKLLGITI